MFKRIIPLIMAAFCANMLFSCSRVEKNVVGEKYFGDLEHTLKKEFNYEFKPSEKTLFFILYYDSMCSCNGKYNQLVEQIINREKDFRHVVLLKNDFKHTVEKRLNNGKVEFLKDTTRILEKNGNLFRIDKLFVVDDRKYVNMFDLEDQSIKKVKQYFDL